MATTDALSESQIEALIEAKVQERVDAILQPHLQALAARQAQPPAGPKRKKRLALVASKGSLDMAYPPLILATTAAALGWEAGVFFTFYGLDIINRSKLAALKVPSVGNPAMPVPVPNALGMLPGMTLMATEMMKSWFRRANIPTIRELLDEAQSSGVQLMGCTTTMGVMGVTDKDLIAGVSLAGAAAFLDFASEADVTLFV